MGLDPSALSAGVAATPRHISLTYKVLAVLNWLMPKGKTKVVLHSPVDVEDGVLATLEGLVVDEPAAKVQNATTRNRFTITAWRGVPTAHP